MTINASNTMGFLVFIGFFAVYFSAFLNQYIPILKGPLLIVFLVLGVFLSFSKAYREDLKITLAFFFIPSFLILLGGLAGYNSTLENIIYVFFYFPIILGYVFSFRFELFFKLIKCFIVINLLAMSYEFLTISYFLEPTSDLPMFIGRAKGFISYSKEAGSFILLFTLLFIQYLRPQWFIALLFSSILTGSRLAMLIVFLAIIIEIVNRMKLRHIFSPVMILVSLASLLIILYGIYLYSNLEQSTLILERLAGTLDTDHSSNTERINFWTSHLGVYDDFDHIQYLFGSPGESIYIVKNGAESALINLLTDGGVVAVLVYMSAIIFMFFLIKLKVNTFLHLLLLIFAMQLSRVNIGFLDATLFWAYFGYLVKRSTKGTHSAASNNDTFFNW
ncbi:MAG: hypothetical protein R3203_01925 [Pseudoalteromonas tetraodonis]|nr:hypothetical protein [Pseudoalteromonas tetraodonis]